MRRRKLPPRKRRHEPWCAVFKGRPWCDCEDYDDRGDDDNPRPVSGGGAPSPLRSIISGEPAEMAL
jgi:hypothetical protein